MSTTLTAKLKLLTTPDQFQALRATRARLPRCASTSARAYSFAHGKTSNRKRLQKATYPDLRSQFGLPAKTGLQCPAPGGSHLSGAVDQSEAERRSPPSHATPNGASRGWTKHLIASLRHSPTISVAITRLSAGRQVSLLTPQGRIHIPDLSWNRHVALLPAGIRIGGAKLWYDRSKQRFYLLVSLTIETPDPTPEGTPQVPGVDVGQRYLATVATLDNSAQFFTGKEIRNKADHYARLQKRLEPQRHVAVDTATHRRRRGRRDG